MARPGKQGIDYFPLDVHLDNKIKFLVIKYGLEGLGAIVAIFQEVYANGYWCKWREDEKLIFTHENNISIDRLDEIVEEALERDIFDKDLFDKYGVLTSTGVQKRYQEIVKRRKDVEITSKYLLIEGNFGTNEHIVIDECIHDVDIVHTSCSSDVDNSKQSKVKERKVKDSRVEDSKVQSEGSTSTTSNKNILTTEKIEQIVNEWNKLNLQNLRSINNNTTRHTMLKARIKDYSFDEVIEAIRSIADSEFLQGSNNRGWTITFDWLIRPNNFIKVLEGNYIDDKGGQNGGNKRGTEKDTAKDRQYEESPAERAGIISF